VVADDSGIVVDALGGRPGVHSARYAGPAATDEENNRKLLEELRGAPEEKRTAHYVCVLALAQANRTLALFSASCEGRLLEAPRGTGGFGYDPLFFFPPLGKTMAELEVTEKNLHSHRGKAFRKLLAYLRRPS
jgi:XTP/dITP diphosphohydrolase